MTEHRTSGWTWRHRMTPRNPEEQHRAATPLELLLDLCFVVAVAQVALRLEHALAEGHFAAGIPSYFMVFFAIWWAWMNFSWFASAFDTDDVPYRLSTLLVMTGVLVLAAGVPRAFDDGDFAIVFVGYLVMRVGLVAQQVRAATAHPQARTTMLRYAGGESLAMAGWAVVIFALPEQLRQWGFLAMVVAELLVPLWADRAWPMPWHPHHIAERYGLLTIIVLGETILSATNAFRDALTAAANIELLLIAAGGLLIVFAMWWVYFSMNAGELLATTLQPFLWGYGHYVIFAAGAAVGAGLSVNIAQVEHHTVLSTTQAGLTVTVPVFCYLLVVWWLMVRPHGANAPYAWTMPLLGTLILAASFTPYPVPVAGVLMALLIAVSIYAHSHRPSTAD
ncbi:low temperature requirement protein A [Nocardia sp. XZ_19_385]|uniref:low temperature requirement protein A n=1 Tax=Nocardia sp. XZ_19_385 TaxID=2769488 RepID=UPI001E5F11CB|nr:low temperature requirement protein A [Nocardia sp. XZ_19_385]